MRRVSILAVATFIAVTSCSSDSADESSDMTTSQSSEAVTTTEAAPTTAVALPPSIVTTSTAHDEGDAIPVEFICDGDGTQPPYTVSGLPDGRVSIAVTMDATVPGGVCVHWIQHDMPPESEIPQDAFDVGAIGVALFNMSGHVPPCPRTPVTHVPSPYSPQGEDVDTYTVQVFAINALSELDEGATKRELLDAIEGRVIGCGELAGEYSGPADLRAGPSISASTFDIRERIGEDIGVIRGWFVAYSFDARIQSSSTFTLGSRLR